MKNFFPSRTVSCCVLFRCCSFNLKIKPYNKSFIDQACSVKMAGYWPHSFFAFLWTSTLSWSIKTQKRTWPISSHLDRTSFVNDAYVHLYSIRNSTTWKYCSVAFNSMVFFRISSIDCKIRTTLHNTMHNTTAKFDLVPFLSMLALDDLIQRLRCYTHFPWCN